MHEKMTAYTRSTKLTLSFAKMFLLLQETSPLHWCVSLFPPSIHVTQKWQFHATQQLLPQWPKRENSFHQPQEPWRNPPIIYQRPDRETPPISSLVLNFAPNNHLANPSRQPAQKSSQP